MNRDEQGERQYASAQLGELGLAYPGLYEHLAPGTAPTDGRGHSVHSQPPIAVGVSDLISRVENFARQVGKLIGLRSRKRHTGGVHDPAVVTLLLNTSAAISGPVVALVREEVVWVGGEGHRLLQNVSSVVGSHGIAEPGGKCPRCGETTIRRHAATFCINPTCLEIRPIRSRSA